MKYFNKEGLHLEGERTRLELFSEIHRDDPAYLNWLRDPDVVRTLYLPDYLAGPVPYEEVKTYCNRMINSETDLFLALTDKTDDRFVGTWKAGHTNWYAGISDIGIMVGDKGTWGKSLAQDSIFTLCRYLFQTVGLRKLTSGAMAINPAMIKVFEKLGFRREALMRAQDRIEDGYCDHVHFGCFPDELRAPTPLANGQ